MLNPVMPQIAVIGLGNVLVGDDAFGPFVARQIAARYAMPDGVDVLDFGTPGSDLGPHIAGVRALIVIDTVKSSSPAGTLLCYRKPELLARGPTPRTNPHQPSLVDTLYFLDLQDLAPPEVLLIGVVPDRYDTGAPLSAPLRLVVEQAMDLVVGELERFGYRPQLRDVPGDPDIWWERPTASPVRPAHSCGPHMAAYVREREGDYVAASS